MALTPSNMLPLKTQAPDFDLVDAVTGDRFTLSSFAGARVLVVMFLCNHCPFVIHVRDEITRVARDYAGPEVAFAAINSNDVENYPDDSPEHMKTLATELGWNFPFLFDEDQSVARAYDAACTPDFFGYNARHELQYRGRLDESKTTLVPGARRELLEAMREVARTGNGPEEQIPSMGCSIKWSYAA